MIGLSVPARPGPRTLTLRQQGAVVDERRGSAHGLFRADGLVSVALCPSARWLSRWFSAAQCSSPAELDRRSGEYIVTNVHTDSDGTVQAPHLGPSASLPARLCTGTPAASCADAMSSVPTPGSRCEWPTRRRLLLSGASLGMAALAGCNGEGWSSALPVVPARPVVGLDFPGSAAVKKTMRFRFLNPLAIYPATYIWWALPRRQAGYYTAFFWGNDDGKGTLDTFLWAPGRDADSYYGAHPYPVPPPHGIYHRWEISVLRTDILNGAVTYDRWHLQAFRAWADRRGKHHEFYWDLPQTGPAHRVTYTACQSWGNRTPPVPALTWGDAPWAPGREVWHGVLSGIRVYDQCLSLDEILAEAQRPASTPRGAAALWYLNLEPTPGDINDKSGRGHHPHWVGDERPREWRAA